MSRCQTPLLYIRIYLPSILLIEVKRPCQIAVLYTYRVHVLILFCNEILLSCFCDPIMRATSLENYTSHFKTLIIIDNDFQNSSKLLKEHRKVSFMCVNKKKTWMFLNKTADRLVSKSQYSIFERFSICKYQLKI
jgi:hypothetical protein